MNRYTRMFPQLAREPATSEVECGLAELGKEMRRCPADDGRTNGAAAFYTYIGQMMDHDLTFDITPLQQAHPFEYRIRNFRTPFLNLEFLYGGGPTVSPFLYDQTSDRGKERFLIGKTRNRHPKKGSEADLPRNQGGIALVGDPRQDENLIVAQLHVWFLKKHNQILEILPKIEQPVGPAGASKFEQARRLLTWFYQKEFAMAFVQGFVDEIVFKTVQDEITTTSFCAGHFCIPIEFSAAAFRFGHSIVRDRYDHYNNSHSPAELSELLEQTGIGGGACPSLREEWKIDLDEFVANKGQEIRPRIARDLFQLPQGTIKLFNIASSERAPAKSPCDPSDDPESMLPVRTLWREARMGLPSGQDIAKVLSIGNAITTQDLVDGPDGNLLHDHGLDEDTPLWYYILREAELQGQGQRLGSVGSWIVAATVLGALRADPNSYLSVDPLWEPPAALSNLFPPLLTSSV